jgi:hypothetical protein
MNKRQALENSTEDYIQLKQKQEPLLIRSENRKFFWKTKYYRLKRELIRLEQENTLLKKGNKNLQTQNKNLQTQNKKLQEKYEKCRNRTQRQIATNIDLINDKIVTNNVTNNVIENLKQDLGKKTDELLKMTKQLGISNAKQTSLQTELDNIIKAYDEFVKEYVYNPRLKEIYKNKQKQQQQSQKQQQQSQKQQQQSQKQQQQSQKLQQQSQKLQTQTQIQNYKQNYNLIF